MGAVERARHQPRRSRRLQSEDGRARAAWATFDPSHLGVPEPFKPFANRVSQRLYAYELRGGQFVRVAAPTEPVTLERLPTSSALPVSRIALTFASTDAFSTALL